VRELFVYYRIRKNVLAEAREAVLRMQRELCIAHPGLAARLLTRQGDAAGAETWMETYALRGAQGAGIDTAIEAVIAGRSACLAPLVDGSRHVEAFDGD
jgi:hypothetical protein